MVKLTLRFASPNLSCSITSLDLASVAQTAAVLMLYEMAIVLGTWGGDDNGTREATIETVHAVPSSSATERTLVDLALACKDH